MYISVLSCFSYSKQLAKYHYRKIKVVLLFLINEFSENIFAEFSIRNL